MIRIVIANAHTLLREGIAALIRGVPDLDVVGHAGEADDVVRLCEALLPDVAIVDPGMPDDAVRTVARTRHACPRTRVLALTVLDDPAHVTALLAAGGAGYLLKGATSEELLEAVREVAAGRSYAGASGGGDQRRGGTPASPVPPPEKLGRRERQVLHGVARGFTSREIAAQLGLRTNTVDTYRTRVQDKLGLSGRAELVAYALRIGLLTQDDVGPEPVMATRPPPRAP
jgi:DNA-binding NarL/FixJ family response regulator